MNINEELYAIAKNEHYDKKNYVLAYVIYKEIIELFPHTSEAEKSAFETEGIERDYPDLMSDYSEEECIREILLII
ncbi:MAG: hypothetical protein FWC16_12475 [Defluviitaleaceae bacterium]|nr:hypothetical protein [Defluviitaleaceae bacterium]MCL2275736.1 hypothetical protein [Defluviitaleaceae bacterium]